MTLEERLRLGQQECGRHAVERTAATRREPDVLSRKSVTNDLQATAWDSSAPKVVLDPAAANHAPQHPEAEQAGEGEPDHGDHVDAEHVRAALGEDPDQAGADQPAGDDHRDHEAVEDDVHAVEQVVQPLVHEADLDLAVAHLLQRVVELVRQLQRHLPEPEAFFAGLHGQSPRAEAGEQQPARIWASDLEDVEVRIEVDADGAERRDRAVEQQEARRQLQVHRVDELERLPDHLQRVDLREAGPVVAVVELAQLREELLLAVLRVAHAEIGEPLRERVDVLRRRVDEHPRQLRHVVVGELADRAEIDQADLVGTAEHEDVRRVRVTVEEAVSEDHRHPRLRHQVREIAAVLDRPFIRMDVCDLRSLEPLECQHTGARVCPVDPRHAHVRMPGEVAVEGIGVARFKPVVELLADLPRELVDEEARVDEVERAHALLRDARGLVEEREVGLDLARRAGTLDLDGDTAPVRQRRAVHLADRRRRDWPFLELGEQLLDRQAELLLDDLLDVRERNRADVVLQAAELGDDVRRQDVGTRREQLPELHERRAELVEHLAEMLSALRRLAVDLEARSAAREEVGQPVGVEPVAEAVADGDLRDLRETPEVPRGGLGHGLSVAPGRGYTSTAERRAHGPGGVSSDSTQR